MTTQQHPHGLNDNHLDTTQPGAAELDTTLPQHTTDDMRIQWTEFEPPAVHWADGDRRALLESVFESSSDAVMVFDRSGRLLDVNPAACQLAEGKSPEQFRGQFVDRWIAEEHRKSFHEALKAVAQSDEPMEVTFDFITRSNQRRNLSVRLVPLRFGQGVGLFVAMCRDRTESAQWEGVVSPKQKLEMVGRVAGEIVHDFNNLLTVINGFSELALHSLDKEHPVYSMLADIASAGDKAAQLSRQFLAFSRRQAFEVKTFDLRTAVLDLEKILRRLLGRSIELVVGPAAGAAPIRADVGQIEQIIMNLVINARDAMPDGGKLAIDIRPVHTYEVPVSCPDGPAVSSYVLLSIRDTGSGMDETTKRRIFEPFFTTKPAGKGTGLGLSSVLNIVEQCQGLIEVLSEPGRGSAFNIYFPRA